MHNRPIQPFESHPASVSIASVTCRSVSVRPSRDADASSLSRHSSEKMPRNQRPIAAVTAGDVRPLRGKANSNSHHFFQIDESGRHL